MFIIINYCLNKDEAMNDRMHHYERVIHQATSSNVSSQVNQSLGNSSVRVGIPDRHSSGCEMLSNISCDSMGVLILSDALVHGIGFSVVALFSEM